MECYKKAQRMTLMTGLIVAVMYLLCLLFVYFLTDAYPSAYRGGHFSSMLNADTA